MAGYPACTLQCDWPLARPRSAGGESCVDQRVWQGKSSGLVPAAAASLLGTMAATAGKGGQHKHLPGLAIGSSISTNTDRSFGFEAYWLLISARRGGLDT